VASCHQTLKVYNRHGALIRCGVKTVHVAFKYLFRSLLLKGVGKSNALPLTSSLKKDDVTIILLLGVSYMIIAQPFLTVKSSLLRS
jgi:hypothetical protein